MGVFGALSNGIRGIGHLAGRCMEKIGAVIRSSAIEKAGVQLQRLCDFGNTRLTESSAVEVVVDVHRELNKVIASTRESAKLDEADIIGACVFDVGICIEDMLSYVQAPDLLRLQERYAAEIEGKHAGQIMKFIQPKLSLDNEACKRVLGIADESERKQRCAAFTDKVLKEAGDQFKKRCSETEKEYVQKIFEIAENEFKIHQAELRKQNSMLQKIITGGGDEEEIDLGREEALIAIVKLSMLKSLVLEDSD